MAKYTVELGRILEGEVNRRYYNDDYKEEHNILNYKRVMEHCYEVLTLEDYPEFIKDLMKNMVRHYYFYEICDTPMMKFIVYLNSTINDNLAKYRQLFKYIELDLNLLDNVDLETKEKYDSSIDETTKKIIADVLNQIKKDTYQGTTTLNTTDNEISSLNSTTTDKTNLSENVTNTNTRKFSDTPQSRVDNLTDGYLTDYTVTTDNTNRSSTTDTTTNTNTNTNTANTGQQNGTNNYTDTINQDDNRTINEDNTVNKIQDDKKNIQLKGKNGGMEYLYLLNDLTEKVVNLRKIFNEDVADCFMQVY